VTGAARITDVTVTQDQVTVGASGNDLVELTLTDADGVVVARGDRTLSVKDPQLWWPNGSGTPYLYHLTATAYTDGEVSDQREFDIGFRALRFFRAAGAGDDAAPYGIEVNGQRIFAKGWNWVPLDLSYGVPRPERLERLLDLAVDAGVNLLRVWGGGLIETPEFYAACDRRGLLVWQEFSQSSSGVSSTPAADEEFVAMMRSQAEQIVPRLRHHPSLAIWGGGNELQADLGEPLTDAPVLTALEDVVRRLDPARLWLPTSPSGPAFLNRLDLIRQAPHDQHDVHGPWEHQGLRDHYELYDEGTAQLLSEFGVEGITMPRTLARVVPEPDRRLPTRGRPTWDHLGRWWNNEALVQASFGDRIQDLHTLGLASQFLQRDGLGYAVEAHRRRWPRCVGTLPWQFNEPYPNAWCTSAVTYDGEPKPAYYAVSAAYRPVLVGAVCTRQSWAGHSEVRLPLWFLSEHPLPPANLTARLLAFTGEELASITFKDVEPSDFLGELRAATPAGPFIVHLQLTAGEVAERPGNRPTGTLDVERRYVLTGADTLADLLDHRTEIDAELVGQQLIVRHVSGPAAPFVRVRAPTDNWLRVSDNGFVLLPGEERTLDIRWEGAGCVVAIDGLGLHPTERLIRCN
jgi:beta-mannosidase